MKYTANYNLKKPEGNETVGPGSFNDNADLIDAALKANADATGGKLDKAGDGSNVTEAFTQAAARANIATGEKHSVIFGKIAKFFADLGGAAWLGVGTATGTVAAGDHTHTAAAVTDFAATVRATVLTGLSTATNAVVVATDSVLGAIGKLQAQITANLTTLTTHTGLTSTAHGAASAATVSTLVARDSSGRAKFAAPAAAGDALIFGTAVPVGSGGTNATTAEGARVNIGAAKALNKTATLAVANWTGSAAPYSYVLSDTDILATDTPFIDRVTGTDSAAAALINTAWALITGYAVKPQTAAGTITFYASAKPSVAIPIMYEVVRS